MANALPEKLLPGVPYPLGANWDGLGVNFAVFSSNAHRIEVCLFDSTGRKELMRFDLPECTDEIWHGYLPGAHVEGCPVYKKVLKHKPAWAAKSKNK